jgi:hypothetical protein
VFSEHPEGFGELKTILGVPAKNLYKKINIIFIGAA